MSAFALSEFWHAWILVLIALCSALNTSMILALFYVLVRPARVNLGPAPVPSVDALVSFKRARDAQASMN